MSNMEEGGVELTDLSKESMHDAVEVRLDTVTGVDAAGAGAGAAVNVDVAPPRLFFEGFFVVMPVFSGYASLFALQKQLKTQQYDHVSLATFEGAASLLYIGNLIFRLGHNIFFVKLRPRYRVYISMGSMALSMLVLFALTVRGPITAGNNDHRPSLAAVFITYFLGGISIGTFEANILFELALCGVPTKRLACTGIPVGIVLITVVSFFLLDVTDNRITWVYFYVFLSIIVGATLFRFRIPDSCDNDPLTNKGGDTQQRLDRLKRHGGAESGDSGGGGNGNSPAKGMITVTALVQASKQWRVWVYPLRFYIFAMMLNMCAVSMFSPGVILYTYGSSTDSLVPTAGRGSPTLQWDLFVGVFNAFYSCGDTTSRLFCYPGPPARTGCIRVQAPLLKQPFVILGLTSIGIGLACSTVGFLSWIGGLCIAFGNGSLYSQTVYFIDKTLPREFGLLGLSVWLFMGDVGSVIGSNLIAAVSHAIDK